MENLANLIPEKAERYRQIAQEMREEAQKLRKI